MVARKARRRLPGTRPARWLLALGALLLVCVAVVWLIGGAGSAARNGTLVADAGGEGRPDDDAAPAFSATTLDGARFDVPSGKPTILFFMAGWCSDCLPEAQALDRIERDLGDRVAVLAVDADPTDPVESLRGFAGYVNARYGFAHDPDGRLTALYRVQSLDTTVVIDAGGRVVFRDAVPTKERALRKALAQAGIR